jgi:hypothetical protein
MTTNEPSVTHYYKLWMDDSDPHAMISQEEDLKGIDRWIIYQGIWIKQWPPGVTFYVEGEHPKDYLFSALHGWMLVSERVRQALERCGVAGVQFLPVRVMHKATGAEIGSYSALNVVRVVEALDWERTRWLTSDRKVVDDHPILAIVRVALRREAVSGVDIFRLRLKQDVGEIFISPRVKQCLERAGATSGFRFMPVPVY